MKETKRNYLIDVFRYIFAMDVVFMHQHPLEDLHYNFSPFITVIWPRLAVIFFMMVSGYFYTNALINEKGKGVYLRYIWKLLKPLLCWSCVYFFIDNRNLEFEHGLLRTFINYTLYSVGSSFHLWFMVDLLIVVSLITLLYKLKCFNILIYISILLGIIGILNNSYSTVVSQISIFSFLNKILNLRVARVLYTPLPFAVFGYYIGYINEKWNSKRKLLILCMLLIVTNILAIPEVNLICKLNVDGVYGNTFCACIDNILLFWIMLAATNKESNVIKYVSNKCKIASSFTYYSHILFIKIIQVMNKHIFNSNLNSVGIYVCVIITTFIVAQAKDYILRRAGNFRHIIKD